MNVAFDDWIPVLTANGSPEKASLVSVLSEGWKYADLSVRPHERVALMRLFICVCHAALDGPKNYDEWLDVPEKLPEAVKKYLEAWRDSFELFHPEKPWLQVAELNIIPSEKEDNSSTEKDWSNLQSIIITKPSGVSSTLFNHDSLESEEKIYSDSEIALNLLTFQNFFVAGGKASSRAWGKNNMKNPPNPKGGPCSGKSIIYSFLRGKALDETIHMNLNHNDDLKFIYPDLHEQIGKPFWEKPIQNPEDTEAIKNATHTHLGRLVPLTRILRVNPDKKRILLGAGFEFPKFQDPQNTFPPDIFATLTVNKNNERHLLSASPSKAVWRQLHSLTVKTKNSHNASRGPLCLRNIKDDASSDLIVSSLVTNPKQAADIVDLIESVFHIPSLLCSSEGTEAYESEIQYAETISYRLGTAIEEYRKEIDGFWERKLKKAGASKNDLQLKLHSTATTHFWTNAEKNLSLLMAYIGALDKGEEANIVRDTWRKMLFTSACDSYQLVCGKETPRQIRAYAKGWDKLTGHKDEKKSDNGGKEENK